MKTASALHHLLIPLVVLVVLLVGGTLDYKVVGGWDLFDALFIVAIKKPDGKMLFNPGPESMLEGGDVLITLGHRQQLDRLESLADAGR